MISKLRNHLILLYTISTSTILAVVISIAFFVLIHQGKQHDIELFQSNIISIMSTIQFSKSINISWITEIEASEQMIINITQNNDLITSFGGSSCARTNRIVLINRTLDQAKKDNIDATTLPLELKRSSIFIVEGDNDDFYYGNVAVIPYRDNNFSSITFLHVLDKSNWIDQSQIIFLIATLIIGILILYTLSRFLVGKSIKPVEKNINKQTEFIAAVSHELRSPLAVIQMNITAISSKDPSKYQLVTTVNNECHRMSRLIEDMLILASSDAKTWTIKKLPTELDTLLIEIYESFESICRTKGTPLSLILPEKELPVIAVDKERLFQALSILIDNAISYAENTKGIILRASFTSKNVLIEVEDHGIGIPDDKKSQVFDRFYCMDKSRTDKSHFGLGLSIAYEIIQLHNGHMELKDTEGGGATFVVSLVI